MGVFKAISALQLTKRKEKAVENQEPSRPRILHQRKCLKFCLLHALNNLFQGDVTFTRSELDDIARDLYKEYVPKGFARFFSSLFNTHYSMLTGNYDVAVLFEALRKKDAYWSGCNQRTFATNIDFDNPVLVGFILYRRFGKSGHWCALRKIDNVWYDLDSYLPEPRHIGESNEDVREFLGQCFRDHASVLLVCKN